MILFKAVTITLIVIPIFWGTYFPDADLSFKSHRNITFHSLLIPFIIMIFNFELLTILILLSTGFHCWCDITIFKNKMKGTYTIVLIPSVTLNFLLFKTKTKEVRMNGILSTVWLVGNFIISLIIFIVYMVLL